MPIPLLHIDAFTDKPFAGNPAAVCLLDGHPDEAWMQNIAAEMNLAETAFVERWMQEIATEVNRTDTAFVRRTSEAEFSLRWFTPLAEVPLCGHATLASAHALWQEGWLRRDQTVTFHTRSGELRATGSEHGITLDFPAIRTEPGPMPPHFEMMLSAPVVNFECAPTKYLAEVPGEEAVRNLTPDMTRIAALAKEGVIATARSDSPEYDFVSRFFAPRLGIPEDPVTGSAHCVLATYWAQRLGKTKFRARQVSKRGGDLLIELDGDRVKLTGQAVTVFRTELNL